MFKFIFLFLGSATFVDTPRARKHLRWAGSMFTAEGGFIPHEANFTTEHTSIAGIKQKMYHRDSTRDLISIQNIHISSSEYPADQHQGRKLKTFFTVWGKWSCARNPCTAWKTWKELAFTASQIKSGSPYSRSWIHLHSMEHTFSCAKYFNKVTYLLNYLLLLYLNSLTVLSGIDLREFSNITESPLGTQHNGKRKTSMRGM